MPEEPIAEIFQKRLADAGDENDRDPAQREADERETEVDHDREVERTGVADPAGVVLVEQARVDAVLHQQGPGQQRDGLSHQHKRGDDDLPALWTQHPEQAPDDPRRFVARQGLLGNVVAPPAHYSPTPGESSTSSSATASTSASRVARASTSR